MECVKCADSIRSVRMSRSGERDLITSDIGRGVELKLILQYEWLARNRESVTPGEARIKQAVWQWFSSLHGADLQRVSETSTCCFVNANWTI